MAVAVLGLQRGVNAQSYCSSGLMKHGTEKLACSGPMCGKSLHFCHKFCKDEKILANHPKCARAVYLTEKEEEEEEGKQLGEADTESEDDNSSN